MFVVIHRTKDILFGDYIKSVVGRYRTLDEAQRCIDDGVSCAMRNLRGANKRVVRSNYLIVEE